MKEPKNISSKKDSLIVKSNALINARLNQKYTLNEQRLILWILSNINEKYIKQNEELILGVSDFTSLTGVSTENIYREAKSIATNLLSKSLLIEEEGEKGFVACNWFSGIRYKSGKFYIRIYEGLIPHLINLRKCFTSYKLNYALTLQSSYAIRLYELLSQYTKIGERTFEVAVLRKNLGVAETELKQFGHFKTRVLEISKREINSKTDMEIDWQETRKGRKVTHIYFEIKTKKKPKELITSHSNKKLLDSLVEFGLSLERAQTFMSQHENSYLTEKLEYIKAKIKAGNAPKNPIGFLIDAISSDYVTNFSVEPEQPTNNEKFSTEDQLIKELNSVLQAQKSQGAQGSEKLMKSFLDDEQRIREKLKELQEE